MNRLKIIYHFYPKKIFFRFFSIVLIPFFILGCQLNPATGKNEVSLISENEEDNIGKQEHPKILKQFGGKYENKKLQNYINSLGNFIVSTSEMPDKKFTFTILDSPIVNAFALPGGYIYLTRGLISLCQNEAQLAGVIAHEIGHVTARHTARRYTKSVGTGLLANILGSLTKNYLIRNLIGQSASLYLLSFSREQEYEADMLSTRYMIRAGFDPREMAMFLKNMEKYSKLQKKINKSNTSRSELLQTHPTSSKRVMEVINNSENKIPINPIIGEGIFLKKIDNMIFGDSERDGFFYKGKFFHKELKISFDTDENFYFINNPKYIVGTSENDSIIIFDLVETKKDLDKKFVTNWLKISERKITDFRKIVIDNFPSVYATVKKSGKKFSLVAINNGEYVFRFALISDEKDFDGLNSKFKKIALSFKNYTNEDFPDVQPPRIRVISYSENENSLSKITENLNLQVKYSEEIFNIINNIEKNKKINKKLKSIY